MLTANVKRTEKQRIVKKGGAKIEIVWENLLTLTQVKMKFKRDVDTRTRFAKIIAANIVDINSFISIRLTGTKAERIKSTMRWSKK